MFKTILKKLSFKIQMLKNFKQAKLSSNLRKFLPEFFIYLIWNYLLLGDKSKLFYFIYFIINLFFSLLNLNDLNFSFRSI